MDINFPDLTPSRSQSLVCPKRFHADYVEKPRRIEWNQKLAYANGAHASLKRALDPKGLTPPAERDIDSIVRRSYKEQYYPDEPTREDAIEEATTSVRSYVEALPDSERILDVEVFAKHEFRVEGSLIVPMGARFDALMVRDDEDGTLVALDYKASSPRGILLWGACVSYVVAHANLGRFSEEYGRELNRVVLEYRFLGPTGMIGRTILTREDVKCVWNELKIAAANVYGDPTFPANRGEHCCGCALFRECNGEQPPTTEADSMFN